MIKTVKKLSIFLLSIVILIYISFVAILPIAVKPIKYKEGIQKLVKDNSGLDFDFKNAKIITTPLLAVGLKAQNTDLSLPENKNIFHADDITFRISLPSLLFKTVKVTYAKIENPTVNIDINDKGTNYEIADYFEEYFSNKPDNADETTDTPETKNNFNLDFKINKFITENYLINITDNKTKHQLTVSGKDLLCRYSGKNLYLKTNPQIQYDKNTQITANIDFSTYIPEITAGNENTQTANAAEFFNPVEIFRTYNIKSVIDTKLAIEQGEKTPKIKGFFYLTDTSVKISKMQLPPSYVKLDFGGYNVNIDTKLHLTENEKADILGSVRFNKNFNADIAVKTDKLYLSNIFKLSLAVLDALNCKNDLNTISANGYFQADMKLKTDLQTIKSSGMMKIADGIIRDSATGLLVNNIKANLLFKDNNIVINDTEASVNGTPFIAEGKISENSDTDIKIHTKNLGLAKLFATFAPADLKKQYIIKNGILSLDILLQGKISELAPKIKTEIVNLVVKDKINGLDITNGSCNIEMDTDFKTYNGTISNKNLVVSAPDMFLTVRNALSTVLFDDKNITIKPTDFVMNGVSTFNIYGYVNSYIKKPDLEILGTGSIRSIDIKNLAGKDMAPFIKSAGVIPVKLNLKGDDKKQTLTARMYGNANEYVTPIDINEVMGKTSTVQLVAEILPNKIHIKQTGLYAGEYTDLSKEIQVNPVISVNGGINLDKNMTINNLKIATNGNKKLSLFAFTGSSLNGNMDITVTGSVNNPILKGTVKTDSINIPQLKTKIKTANVVLNGDTFKYDINELNLNGTSIDVNGNGLLDYKPITTLSNFVITSEYLDSDKAIKVTEYMAKVPALNSGSGNASIPVKITSGALDIKKLKSGDIVAENITSKMTLNRDVVNLNNLKASAFDGQFEGDVSMNLLNSAIKATVKGSGMNADKTVTTCAGMKNTIYGTLKFDADINLKGATYEEQMRTLNGKANFDINKGQFGSLGKLETFLKADNLASISFISTKIGSMVNNVSPHNTAEFEKLNGNVTFKNGLMTILPITSSGKNMSLYITGNLNLVNNQANILVLGRISENMTSMLGPLEQLNPVKLLQKSSSTWATITLGALNAINEKSTPAEISKIPQLTPPPATDNTSKFVVKINGNIEKPQSAVKSFKWLSADSDLTKAQNAISPKEVIENTVKAIPKTKEEAINTIKETGKNTLLNLGKQLLNQANETKSDSKNEEKTENAE